MRVGVVILAVLAACGDDRGGGQTGCQSPNQDFSIDAVLTEADIATLLGEGEGCYWPSSQIADRSEITCDDACHWVHVRNGTSPCQTTISEISSCEFMIDPEPGATPEAVVGMVTCAGIENPNLCVGRRPLGHVELDVAGEDLVAYFVRNAYLEAAAVVAFEQLAGLLVAWDAPPELVARCRQAAVEEARHAELLRGLAEVDGAVVPPAQQRPHALDRWSVALHNAIEGCVHEAWAALCATWIARHAGTPELRAIFAELAADEAGHAQIAWDLHTWFLGQMTPEQGERLAEAQRAAMAGLTARARDEAAGAPAVLGLPDAGTIARLSGHFVAGLSAAA